MAAARGRTIAFTDADLAYSPDQLLGVLGEVEAGWDVAVGSRRHPQTERVRGAGALRDLGSRAVNLLAMGVLLSHPHDTQCGLKAFRSDVAKTSSRSAGSTASRSTSRCSTSSSATASR